MYYKDFYKLVSDDIGDSYISFYRYVINYFNKYRDQKTLHTVDIDRFSDLEVINCFKGFSIAFGSSLTNVTKYIAFVGVDDPLEDFRTFMRNYIPDGVIPTHLYVESADKSEIDRCYSIIKEKHPDIELTQSTYHYSFEEARKEEMLKIIKDESLIFDIQDYCSTLAFNYDEHNPDFIKRFTEVVNEIELKADKKYIVYLGDFHSIAYTKIYPLIISELYIRNSNCRFYFSVDESINKMSLLSSTLFNPDLMMKEDMIDFLMHLPKLVAMQKGSSLVYHVVKGVKLSLSLSYVPLKDLKSKVSYNEFNAKSLKIVPFKAYYDLESDDFQDNIDSELKCRELIKELYEVFDVPNNETIKITDLIIFVKDDVEYIGYCRRVDFKASCVSYMSGQSLCEVILNLDDVRNIIYLDYVLNKKAIIAMVNKALNTNILNVKSVVPKRVMRPLSNLYMNYKVATEFHYNRLLEFSYWQDIPNSVFLNCMYSPMAVKSRIVTYGFLINHLGVNKVRNMLDSFGGFNLVTNFNIQLSTFEVDNT